MVDHPRMLKDGDSWIICEDYNGDGLFEMIWQAKLDDSEYLVGFESDGESFKSARVSKQALIDFALAVVRELVPMTIETGTDSGTGNYRIDWQ